MTETTGTIRISKVVKEIGVGISTIVEHLSSKGFKIDSNPNGKITEEQYQILLNDFQSDKKTLEDAKQLTTSKQKAPKKEEVLLVPEVKPKVVRNKDEEEEDSILIKSGLVPENAAKTEPTTAKPEKVEPLEEELPKAEEEKKTGLKVMGKIDLDAGKKSKKTTEKPTVKKEEPKKEIKTEIKIY